MVRGRGNELFGCRLLVVLALAACGDEDTEAPRDDSTSTGGPAGSSSSTGDGSGDPEPAASYEVVVRDSALVLLRDETTLLALPVEGFQWGVVDAIDEGLSYDPMFDMPVSWRPATSMTQVGDDPLVVRLAFDGGGHAQVVVSQPDDGRFELTWKPDGEVPVIAAHRLSARVDATEGFYGLGEWFDTPNHRGQTRPMQLEADFSLETNNNEAHVPIPLLIGTTGWGVFVEDPHPGRFDVATDAEDLVQITFGTGPDSAQGLRFHLFGAEHPLDVTGHYHAVTGAPILPAPWALGPWLWRDENDDQAQVEDDARTMRELDLAGSGMWIDRPYATGVNTFDFEPTRFSDPQTMIDLLHDLGYAVALWHTPYLSDDSEPAPVLRAEAVAAGYFPPQSGPRLNPWSEPLDFTNPDALHWWQSLLRGYTDMGIEGFKLDYAEDVLPGLAGQRTPWLFHDGSTDRTMQAQYQLGYHRAYAELLPREGGFLLCRAGTYGDQTQVSVVWPGDLDADMNLHREEVDGSARVGGLPAAVVAGSSLGPSGFPLFASDTGGYRHAPPDKETMTRWFQHTALTPVMQIGTGSSDVAWEYTPENGFDDEMLGWYRDYTRLHLRLFPYLWTYVTEVPTNGRAIVRPLGFAYPELGEHPRHDYMLGDDLLVAPVVERDQRSRPVIFPAGQWVDWFDGTVIDGGQTLEVDAPLSKLPLFLRAGGIVPMLRPSIDTLRPVSEGSEIDSFAADAGLLYVRIAAGPHSQRELYDGGTVEQRREGDSLTLRWSAGTVFGDGVLFEVVAIEQAPDAVKLSNIGIPERSVDELPEAVAGWAHEGRTLWIRVPDGQHTATVVWG